MCLSQLAVLNHFCGQKGHGVFLCFWMWILKLASVGQYMLPHLKPGRSGRTFTSLAPLVSAAVVVSSLLGLGTSAPSGVSASVGGGWALGCGDGWAVGCGTRLAAAAGGFLWCLLLWILRAFWSLRALLQRLHTKWVFLQWLNKSRVVYSINLGQNLQSYAIHGWNCMTCSTLILLLLRYLWHCSHWTLCLPSCFTWPTTGCHLLAKGSSFGGADHFHHFYHFGIYLPGYFDVRSHVCLECGCAWQTFAWLTWLACRVVVHAVFYQQRFWNESNKAYVTKEMTVALLTMVT